MRPTWLAVLVCALAALALASLLFGEVPLSAGQWASALGDPASGPAEVVFGLRAPRTLAAASVGAALGLAGAVMQGLLRNPLADPGVLGVSAGAGFGAALVIVTGVAAAPLALGAGAMGGALAAGAAVAAAAALSPSPDLLILFGVAVSSLAGAATALVFNLSPSPVATAEVLDWLLGSVEGRGWGDLGAAAAPLLLGAGLSLASAPALRVLTLGEETAALSGLPMTRLRLCAVGGAALLAGSAVALAGVIGFVGLAAPHLVRRACRDDPGALLGPAAGTGALLVLLADLAARLIPTNEELKLGVVTALFGAPAFALLAWRSAGSWRR